MEKTTNQRYAAFLRGINVGGKHKVPMAELRKVLETMGFGGVKTLLNSGNVVFSTADGNLEALEGKMEARLQETFGFPIPIIIRNSKEIGDMISADPFMDVAVTPDIRLYVSLLKRAPNHPPELPWVSPDESFRIIKIAGKAAHSILDLSKTKTVDAMSALEKFFSKEITTRNWNTIQKIHKLLFD